MVEAIRKRRTAALRNVENKMNDLGVCLGD